MRERLCLGTVQFGLDYGVSNFDGMPTVDAVDEILSFALESGIKILDTARAYGVAEERIGLYLNDRSQTFSIISKVRPNIVLEHPNDVRAEVEKSIMASIENLGIKVLDGCLLHTPSDYYNEDVMFVLEKLKAEGLIKNIGVSIYELEDAIKVLKDNRVDYLQVMYNVFDQRIDNKEFEKYKELSNIKVFARSVFLQGLLTMNLDVVPEKLDYTKKYLYDFYSVCNKYKMSPQEVAIHFALANNNLDYIIIGVDTIDHLKENINFVDKYSFNLELVNELKEKFSMIDKAVYFPSLWS